MKLCGIIFGLFIAVSACNAYQDSTVSRGNLEIIGSIISADLDEVENGMVLSGREKIYGFSLGNNDESGKNELNRYLGLSLRQRFENYRIVTGNIDSADVQIIFDKPRIKTEYLGYNTVRIAGDKQIKRRITVGYTVKLLNRKTNDILYTKDFIKVYTDNFKADDLGAVESRNYSFGYAGLPQEGFFSRFLVPVIVIAASAAAVILFFSIRSE